MLAATKKLVSCPINNLLDPPADFRAGQGAPTSPRHLKGTGEEAQRRPARKDAAQRVSYLWDRTLDAFEVFEGLETGTAAMQCFARR
jgi:hypothetical protein